MSDSITTEPTSIRHRIGDCPACRCGLYALVDVATIVYPPTIDKDGRTTRANAMPRVLGMTMSHACHRDDEGDWVVVNNMEPA
jgi:hypothetical protein